MAADLENPRTRRAILGAAAAAAMAGGATLLLGPLPVAAADGDIVHVGDFNLSGDVTTGISCSGTGPAIRGTTTHDGSSGVGVLGYAAAGPATGVTGQADGDQGVGVLGLATDPTSPYAVGVRGSSMGPGGAGVEGQAQATSGQGVGVSGSSASPNGIGVAGGTPAGGTGVSGIVGGGAISPTPSTGVFGCGGFDSTSRGVVGQGFAGQGVRGEAENGIGVRAIATTGTALAVEGRATFNRSGRALVLAGHSSVDIVVPGGLASSANILATIQAFRSGTVVAGVRPNYPSSGRARIYLNKIASTSSATPVAWFVVG